MKNIASSCGRKNSQLDKGRILKKIRGGNGGVKRVSSVKANEPKLHEGGPYPKMS